MSGNEVRRALGLRSTLFAVNADAGGGCPAGGPAGPPGGTPPAPPPPPPPAPPPPPPVEPPPPPADHIARVAGPERVVTAVEVSRWHWATAQEVVLATAFDFPDALAGAALAARRDAPLLLNEAQALSPVVLAEIARLQARRVTLLGGTNALSQAVEDALRATGLEVRRLAGEDRYATAARVAAEAGIGADAEVTLALGTDFADAVSAGALAATPGHLPTLLTAPDGLPPVTAAALAQVGARRVVVVGGTGAVSEAVANQVQALGYEVSRLAGPDRFATSAATARAALARFGEGSRPVVLASGSRYPDALAAGPLAARLDAGLLLVPDADLEAAPAAAAVLREYAAALDSAVLVGGVAAVGDGVRDQTARAITAPAAPAPPPAAAAAGP
jgi:putative cell wall-binding protein